MGVIIIFEIPPHIYMPIFIMMVIIVMVLFILYLFFKSWIDVLINKFHFRQLERCSGLDYLPYVEIPQDINPAQYNYQLAKSLLTSTMNTSISNCQRYVEFRSLMTNIEEKYQIIKEIKATVDGNNDMYAYIFYSNVGKYLIVAFTGTFFLNQWILDMQYRQMKAYGMINNAQPTTLVHSGFLKIYNGIKDEIRHTVSELHTNNRLFITGISLGAALATICAMDLASYKPQVYTFASPRVFNVKGAELMNSLLPNIFRVFNTEDMIPDYPLPIHREHPEDGYMHIGINVPFTINLGTLYKNHVNAYIGYLPETIT